MPAGADSATRASPRSTARDLQPVFRQPRFLPIVIRHCRLDPTPKLSHVMHLNQVCHLQFPALTHFLVALYAIDFYEIN
jgi:hypothetical protein